MTDLPSSTFYASNRQRLMEAIGPHGVAVIFSAPEATYSHDVHYVYRQNSYLHYLTGFAEANSVLVLAPGHETPYTLFVMPRDLEKKSGTVFARVLTGPARTLAPMPPFPLPNSKPAFLIFLPIAASCILPLAPLKRPTGLSFRLSIPCVAKSAKVSVLHATCTIPA